MKLVKEDDEQTVTLYFDPRDKPSAQSMLVQWQNVRCITTCHAFEY